MSNIRKKDLMVNTLLAHRQRFVAEAKKFEYLLNDPSPSTESIDASIEEFRPLRMAIRAIDPQIRELSNSS